MRENDLRWCILKLKSQKCGEKRQNRNVWDRKERDTDGNDRTIPDVYKRQAGHGVNSNYFISLLYCLNEKRFTKKREYGIIIEENTVAEL